MNVSLTPDLEQKMKRHVASGRFGSPGEVIGEGLCLLEEQEEWENWDSPIGAHKSPWAWINSSGAKVFPVRPSLPDQRAQPCPA